MKVFLGFVVWVVWFALLYFIGVAVSLHNGLNNCQDQLLQAKLDLGEAKMNETPNFKR